MLKTKTQVSNKKPKQMRRKKRHINYLFVLFLLLVSKTLIAQDGLCPPNLDFEKGDFSNWNCRAGSVNTSGGNNTVSLQNTGPIDGRHTIISKSNAGTDPYGGFSELCPNGSGYSMKLGNSNTGREAESISYTYTIPSTLSVFSILFHYAVVLQNPGHSAEQQPRFRARIIDLSTNSPLSCVSFDFTASSSLPGFKVSSENSSVLYKDWTPVSINLSSYIGRTIMLEFITSDCTQGGHFGYAYIDVNTVCNGAITGSTICLGDNSITLKAPYGFQSYKWYSDNSFSQLLSSSQSLLLAPPPTVGSIFPIVVQPYPGFGCIDTLHATISITSKPTSIAGTDTSICKDKQIQLGAPGTPAYSYEWIPTNQVNNSTISNPAGWNIGDQTSFIVKTTDLLTGCYSYDTSVVSTIKVDTTVSFNGSNESCIGNPITAFFSVNGSSTAVQWYDLNGLIPGATSTGFQPTINGGYWASVTQRGCTDSSDKHLINIIIHPLPQAIFSPVIDSGCVATNSFKFTNSSYVGDNSLMTYLWRFSDGSSAQTQDVTKTFLSEGSYLVKLVTLTSFGCKDSTTGKVYVLPNGSPDFVWDSICTNRTTLFKNLSNEHGWPRVNYNWEFNNGGPNSALKNPSPVRYNSPGYIDVTLHMTVVGCENDPQSITKSVLVNKPVDGIKYRDITVPLGSSKFIQARDKIGNAYDWQPKTFLSSYSKRYTEFYATSDDVMYLINITDQHTCVITDTLQMFVLKKPGFYVPSGFTPNDDGLNDVIKPYLIGMKSFKSFSIYNRSGNLIFYSTKYGEGWDGTYKSIKQATGVYVWLLAFTDNDNKIIVEKGTITLIR